MGRVYHYLLLEAKYLGTYYTSVPAATLLLKIALSPGRWSRDWTDIASLRNFQVGDLACGTGTLLMSVSQVITDNFVRACVKSGKAVDSAQLKRLHQVIMEDVLHGYDVLPSAVHLTASTLALLAPEIAFKKMQLYSVPLGKLEDGTIYLGSIEYLGGTEIQTQLDLMGNVPARGAAGALSGTGVSASVAPLPALDLCVMNPPFVRSVNSNLLFGSMPQHRQEMRRELAARLRGASPEIMATTTAGLASIFTAIADMHLKPAGRLALVLPAALQTGGAWSRTRALIDSSYELEWIVSSHDAERWSFSENTDLSEVLLVARKHNPSEPDNPSSVCRFVNLWINPTGAAEALAVAEALAATAPALIGNASEPEHGTESLIVGNRKFGEVLAIPLVELHGEPWLGAAFAQTPLVRANWLLRKGSLILPGAASAITIPICHLDELGELGPDGRDIHDGFTRGTTRTSYPAFWNHDAEQVGTMEVEPNSYLTPRAHPAPGRPARPVELLWPRASNLLLAVRLRLNTHRLVATRTNTNVLSNVWYPFRLHSNNESHEKALALWLNSTLGIMLLAGHRVPTQGAWVQFKKPTWNPMPVLDVRRLSEEQLRLLASAYDRLSTRELRSLPDMEEDAVRVDLDSAVQTVLGLPSLAPLRALLANEPIIRNSSLGLQAYPPPEQKSEQFELLLA